MKEAHSQFLPGAHGFGMYFLFLSVCVALQTCLFIRLVALHCLALPRVCKPTS